MSWARGEVVVREDPIWRMAPDSEPRRRLLGVLRRYAQGNSVSVARAGRLADQGRDLIRSIEEYLAAA